MEPVGSHIFVCFKVLKKIQMKNDTVVRHRHRARTVPYPCVFNLPFRVPYRTVLGTFVNRLSFFYKIVYRTGLEISPFLIFF